MAWGGHIHTCSYSGGESTSLPTSLGVSAPRICVGERIKPRMYAGCLLFYDQCKARGGEREEEEEGVVLPTYYLPACLPASILGLVLCRWVFSFWFIIFFLYIILYYIRGGISD